VKNGTWQVSHLEQEVGHLEGTAAPGASDNIVLAGHVTLVSGELGPFAQLDKLAPGDLITVYEGDRQYFYLVESRQTVKPSDVSVAYPTNTGQLTLITCTNWSSQQGQYVERLVVKGRLLRG
jgi:LPXTG-site transpeptidase (sortase) family protein